MLAISCSRRIDGMRRYDRISAVVGAWDFLFCCNAARSSSACGGIFGKGMHATRHSWCFGMYNARIRIAFLSARKRHVRIRGDALSMASPLICLMSAHPVLYAPAFTLTNGQAFSVLVSALASFISCGGICRISIRDPIWISKKHGNSAFSSCGQIVSVFGVDIGFARDWNSLAFKGAVGASCPKQHTCSPLVFIMV